ncbi:hypothetical protein D3C78_1967370 [compost metagenome]
MAAAPADEVQTAQNQGRCVPFGGEVSGEASPKLDTQQPRVDDAGLQTDRVEIRYLGQQLVLGPRVVKDV